MRFFVTLLAVGLSICETSTAGTISVEFASYLKRFVHEASIRGVKLDSDRTNRTSIRFSFDLSDYNNLAECDMKTLQVSVSESYWMTASEYEREELLFHELGHCILGRAHEDGTMPISGGTIYKSVMNSYGNVLMSRAPNFKLCGLNNGDDCGEALIYDPKSKNNFYRKFHKIYMDELFGVVAPNESTTNIKKVSSKRSKHARTAAVIQPSPTPSVKPSASETISHAKLRKGMSRKDVVEIFGDPIAITENATTLDGQALDRWAFEGSMCVYEHASACYVYLDSEKHEVVKWTDIKPRLTNYLGD